MGKKLIIHIGMPKTGTTSLQDFLYKNRKFLFEMLKIYYPETGLIGASHLKLAHDIHAKNFNLLEDLSNELLEKSEGIDTVILSSENFFHTFGFSLPIFLVNLLKKKENSISNIIIILYLRRQDKFLDSSYRQLLETIPFFPASFFSDNYKAHRKLLKYYEKINRFYSLLPDDLRKIIKIVIRIYEKELLKDRNIITDFFDVMNVPIQNYNVDVNVFSNPSLSVESTLALRKFNEEFLLKPEVFKKLIDFSYRLDKERISLQKYLLNLQERFEIIKYFHESNQKLFEEILKHENIFRLSYDEIQTYSEHDRYVSENKEKIEAEIEERYEDMVDFVKKEFGNINEYKRHFHINNLGYKGILGLVEEVSKDYIAGWLYNTNIIEPTVIEITIDGFHVASIRCHINREDINYLYGSEYATGFYVHWKDIDYPIEFVRYIFTKLPTERLNIVVKEKISGYGIQGNYEDIYVIDIWDILLMRELNPKILTKI